MISFKIGGVPEHFNLPWHLCIDNGEFKAVGLEVTWQNCNGGTGQMNKALREQDIDIAVILTEGIIKDIADGNPSTIIQEYIASPLIWGVHVAANSKYKSISELEHTKAAISRYGSGSHLLSYIHAESQNWTTSALHFEVVNNLNGALHALPNNEAQYFLWEHYTTKPYVDNGTFRHLGDFPTPWPCFVIAASNSVIETHKKELQLLLDVINTTTREFKHIPMISKTLANVYNQDITDIEDWLALTTWSQKQLTKHTVNRVQDKLLSLQLIEKKLPYSKICL